LLPLAFSNEKRAKLRGYETGSTTWISVRSGKVRRYLARDTDEATSIRVLFVRQLREGWLKLEQAA
jgi:hypothetical protein